MNDTTDLSQFTEPFVLRKGTPVLIRVAVPADREKVVAAFDKLESSSIYSRFFSVRKQLSTSELDRIGGADHNASVYLVALVGTGADETLIGGASYVVLPSAGGDASAEVAFTIEEDYQGQGLATKLMATLTRIARQQGIARFQADVLVGNTPMLNVFQHTGMPMTKTTEGGVTHLVMDLRQPGSAR